MSNIIEYILDLKGNMDDKLKKIGIANDQQLASWAKVQTQVNAANSTMNNMGRSIGSLTQKVQALKAQKEWIPASNTEAIRATNREIKDLEKEINKLNSLNGGKMSKWWGDLKNTMPFQVLTNPIVMATAAFTKLNQYVGEAEKVYKDQSVAETRLAAVMGNTMNASKNEVQSIIDLTRAQEQLGVISSTTQKAGAQELSTYLTKTESLKKLIPVMNDMLAQQYGLNASQEQAQNIATMLGKVMDGQVGALSRYGYAFDKNQEKILKTGTEAQRAAVLFDVVSASVGDVNKALAQTPEGKLAQHANNAEALQARIGELAVKVKAAFLPVQEFFLSIGNSMAGFFEYLASNKEIIYGIAAGVGTMAVAWGAYAAVTNAVRIATAIWTGVQWLLNVALTANPIGVIIMAIGVLIGAIVAIVSKTQGWGKTWNNIMSFMKLGIELFKETISLIWLKIKDTFLSGFEVIAKGWYKLQSLWDKEGAQAALAKIENQRNERAKEIAAAHGKVKEIAGEMAAMKIWEVTTKNKKVGTNDKLQEAVGGGKKDAAGDGAGKATNDAIATGGTRNTTINIKIDDMIKQVTFNGTTSENIQEIERNFAEALYRVLGVAEISAA